MISRHKISRDTWFLEGKYVMRATAKFMRNDDPRRRDFVEACSKVFEADFFMTDKPPLFISEIHVFSNGLEIPLAEVERLGRIFIDTFRC